MYSSSGSRLQIGCFDQPVEGWINTDVSPHIRISRVPGLAKLLYTAGRINEHRYRQHASGLWKQVQFLDAGKRFPFETDSLSAIYSTHVLEHLEQHVVRNLLLECHRVLKPGAVLRIGVPDLDTLVHSYDGSNPDAFVEKMFETKENNGKNRHVWMYNATSLKELLKNFGFSSLKVCAFHEGICPDLDLLDNRQHETIFIEATK